MSRSYFGTDGIRGRANSWPMDAATVLKVGAGRRHQIQPRQPPPPRGDRQGHAAVGLHDGTGADRRVPVRRHGRVPVRADADAGRGHADTLAQGRPRRHDLGLAQSLHDNGIKLFGPDGYKLSDADEAAIEALVEAGEGMALARPDRSAAPSGSTMPQARYIEFAKRTFPKELTPRRA